SADEVRALWHWLDAYAVDFPDPAAVLKLQLLTGARCGEAGGLCAEEIDRDEWVWTLPAARSKNKPPRSTPLVGTARSLIEAKLAEVSRGPLFTTSSGKALGASDLGNHLA